jgi:hypothetical protein
MSARGDTGRTGAGRAARRAGIGHVGGYTGGRSLAGGRGAALAGAGGAALAGGRGAALAGSRGARA